MWVRCYISAAFLLGLTMTKAGTGMSGVIIPFVMKYDIIPPRWLLHSTNTCLSWGLSEYGFRTMLRAWAIVLVVLSGPLLHFVRPRLPLSQNSQRRRFSFGFLRSSAFWVLQTGNIFEGLGFFISTIYLPSYAQSIGLSSVASTLTLSLSNTAAVFGAVLLGSLIDRLHVTTVVLISSIGATASVFLLWGLASSLPVLCMFAILYGLFAGGFTCTYSGIILELQKQEPALESGLVFGMLAAGRGIGSVVSGPLSEALLSSKSWQGEASLGYGTEYGPLIVFTGVSAALSGLGFVGRRVGWV